MSNDKKKAIDFGKQNLNKLKEMQDVLGTESYHKVCLNQSTHILLTVRYFVSCYYGILLMKWYEHMDAQ